MCGEYGVSAPARLRRETVPPARRAKWDEKGGFKWISRRLRGKALSGVTNILHPPGEDMSGWPEEAADLKIAIQDFLAPALGKYLVQRGIILPGKEEEIP